jgi:hypothetical protein
MMPGKAVYGSASLKATGRMRAEGQVVLGWDQYSLLLLSVFLGGAFPLAVTCGITAGGIAWDAMPRWVAFVVGLAAGLLTLGLTLLLLRLCSCQTIRPWLILLARRWLGSSH